MKKTNWMPQLDEEYYSIGTFGPWTFNDDKVDARNIADGNYFQTPELLQQAIDMIKNAFHGYTLKKPALFPVDELPRLEAYSFIQKLNVELIDKENNFMVFAEFWVDIYVEEDGDDFNIPRTTEIKSTLIFDLSFDICDENGDVVKDENGLFRTELLTFLKEFYEK